jgi:hypothetical protein
MTVMPVQASWCPGLEEEIEQIPAVFHYLLILDRDNQKWRLYWWKLDEEQSAEQFWNYQPDARNMKYPNLIYRDFYDVLEEFIYGKLT